VRSGRCHRLAVVAGGIPVSSPEKVELSAEPALGDNHRIKITHRAAVADFARGIGPHVDAPRTRIAQQDRFDPLAFPTLVTQRPTCVPLTPLKRRGRAVEAARWAGLGEAAKPHNQRWPDVGRNVGGQRPCRITFLSNYLDGADPLFSVLPGFG